MPANTRAGRAAKAAGTAAPSTKSSGGKAADLIFRQTLQEALIAGYEDPVAFARYFLDLDPYPAQCTFLRESRDATEATFVAGNRTGKSWTGGVLLSWRAFYRYISPYTAPERVTPHNIYKAVATSLTIDQAKLAWNYALTFMQQSKRFTPFLNEFIYSPFPTIRLRTVNERGESVPSEIWARSLAKRGVYLLGHSLNYVQPDECAYIANYPVIEDEVIRMRLADTGGSLFRLSTPNGRNFFYDYYTHGLRTPGKPYNPRYYSMRIATTDNPYVSKAYLEEARERMLPEYYQQNILGEFVSLSDFFKIEQLQALYTLNDTEIDLYDPEHKKNPFSREPNLSLPVAPVPGGRYVLGADLGALRDPTVIWVLRVDVEPAQVVYLESLRVGTWGPSRAKIRDVWGIYAPEAGSVDATGAGKPIVEQLIGEDSIPVEAFVFSQSSKDDILTRLQDAVQRRKFVFPYTRETQDAVRQLSFYVREDKYIETDYVMGLALAWRAVESVRKGRSRGAELYEDLSIITSRNGQFISDDFENWDEDALGEYFTVDSNTGLLIPVY